MDRTALLLGDATRASRILEIGPSHAPVAPKRDGWSSVVVDHGSADELRAKYADFAVDLNAIEEVDHVWRGGLLDRAIPPALHGSFDRLIASHVIEHIPDLAAFLVSAQALLKPDGALALAVPDKRYCFDALKPLTTTGDILAAHDPAGPGRHSPRTLFNQVAYSVTMDGATAWGQHPVHRPALISALPDAVAAFRAAGSGPGAEYVDAHAWQFTPAAFGLAILELAEAGVIDWHIADITPARGSEFIATLRRGRPAWASPADREARRLELLLATLAEAHEQIGFAAQGEALRLAELPRDPAVARAVAAIEARLGAMETALAPPTDQPARLGTLADLTARLDAQQRRFEVQAAQLDAQQRQFDAHQQQLDALAHRLDHLLAQIDAQRQLLATQDGRFAVQAAQIDAQQQQFAAHQRQLDGHAARLDAALGQLTAIADQVAFQRRQLDTVTAADGTQAAVLGFLGQIAARQQEHQAAADARFADLATRLQRQGDRLDDVHLVAHWVRRLVRPFHRLRARLLGRPPAY